MSSLVSQIRFLTGMSKGVERGKCESAGRECLGLYRKNLIAMKRCPHTHLKQVTSSYPSDASERVCASYWYVYLFYIFK